VWLVVVRNRTESLVDVATLPSVPYQCLVLKVGGEGIPPTPKFSCQTGHVILMECVCERVVYPTYTDQTETYI